MFYQTDMRNLVFNEKHEPPRFKSRERIAVPENGIMCSNRGNELLIRENEKLIPSPKKDCTIRCNDLVLLFFVFGFCFGKYPGSMALTLPYGLFRKYLH